MAVMNEEQERYIEAILVALIAAGTTNANVEKTAIEGAESIINTLKSMEVK